ncbi:hypothetical protein J5J86_09555 [Aquabacter sp. L1I39]|uniref:hypothetical protein n=1 Tax=Aquabacter sp. L1I39 TaxID=2820278 RepID=UPI001AD98403|nr:hypothetical protein [Aquabacter sp. L1I39]QTL05500.1 hypothetical protein J5J86_09555 [Aquabacter sp. L1I39]
MTKTSLILAALVTLAGGAARAETRIFLIENSDAYGIDRCLAEGEPCGERLATAWCRSHDYSRALDYGRVASAGPLTPIASPPANRAACAGPLCPSVVTITCNR